MSSNAWIAAFVIIPVLAVCGIVYGCVRRRRRGNVYYTALNDRKALEAEYQRLLQERDQRLAVEVEKRKAQENDTSPGSHVWFSRYVQQGRLKHWVLVIDNTKYELRRDSTTGKFVANVAPWTIDQEKREAALAELKIPAVDGYYICLIGWTQIGSDQLKSISDQVMSQFGRYNMLWNNCQDFLQQFADRIISQKALDWPWFREHSKTEYQANQKLPPTPDEVIASNANHALGQQNAHNQQQIQQNINQMNQQMNLQNMQLNTQLNTINQQMLLQNNIAMMSNPAMNPGMMGGAGGGGA